MVVVVLQPARELVVRGLVAGREQPLRADIAHQHLVLELGDLTVGSGPLAARLRLEDAAIAVALLVAQHRRQVGRRRLVELDHRRRRDEHRAAGERVCRGVLRWGRVWRRFGGGTGGGGLGSRRGLGGRLGDGLGERRSLRHRRSSNRGQRPRQHDRHELFHGRQPRRRAAILQQTEDAMVSVQQVKAMLKSGEVFGFFDVREEGEFSTQGHPLFATPLPLSRLEPRAFALLPDPKTRIVLMDSGEEGQNGRALRAAAKLGELGYGNVAVMDGGLKAWRDAGYEVFTGVNVPSKAFGEVVEHDNDTPRIDAADVQKLIDSKADMVILDSRPMPEFNNMSIPGGVDCPGAELVYRVKDFAPDPNTLVVVNCAGRTRSIIGAQSLINAGLPNKVMALKNGTMGWHLAGLKVARGETRSFGPQGPEAAKFAQAAAAAITQRMGIKKIDRAGLNALEAQLSHGGGPLHRLDVRDPAEYAQGHLEGFRHAAGGQLVQATDQYVGARNATIVLHDNDGVRATMTAHWLLQMGWKETYVLDHKPSASELTTKAEPRFPKGFKLPTPKTVSPKDIDGALVIDLDTSLRYRDGHVPSAWFAVRANLGRTIPEMLKQQPQAKRIVLVSPDGEIAALAAPEAQQAADGLPVAILAGGMKAWRDAGLPIETGHTRMADPPTDVWYRPYDFKQDVEAAMRQYLDWEVDLVPQVKRDGSATFAVFKR
ncbi:MAG: thiosulfate sulfurtransferase [Alphaproteobacteria bacterium]|nr:MAG: thiosulfate sulfurtransferase [Alphaproteobacteria bacterium]